MAIEQFAGQVPICQQSRIFPVNWCSREKSISVLSVG
jgi:hypothetical protein